jgi:hypothetical protein
VRKGDLNVEDHGDEMRYENEGNAYRPVRECDPDKQVTKKVPVAGHEDDL